MDNRLEVAKSMGATHTYKVVVMLRSALIMISQATREKSAEEMASDVRELLGGQSPDVTIECSGVEASVRYLTNYDISSIYPVTEGSGSWQPSLEAAWSLLASANPRL